MKTASILVSVSALLFITSLANEAAALTTVNSPFGTDAVVVLVAGDLQGTTSCHPEDNSIRRWRQYGVDGSLKTVAKPDPNNPGCELGNFVPPRVMYFDIEPGSPYFGGCATQAPGSRGKT